MNRFLTCTALGLVLGLTPALAQQPPTDDAANPLALEQPAVPEAVPSEPAAPSDPAAPVPGDTSEMTPSQPDAALPQSSEAPKAVEPGASPSSSAEAAPQSIEPAAPKTAEAAGGTQFLLKQESGDYLASNLIGKSVYNSQDEVIGDINDLVSDESGKIVGVLLGSGGFLGIGEKDVAIRFEELKLARDENNDIKVIANLDQETLASAPDYEKLSEQAVSVGASDEKSDQRGSSQTY
jgi:sporulation protein YlmC with PRC-barrel domain